MERILHVDDEPDIREVSQMALEAVGGFKVTSAASGMEALRQVGDCRPELILLDVMMPGMDGPATLQALRRNPASAGIPIIFMTAKVQQHEVDHYLALGAIGVIPKPFDPMCLADQIQKIYEGSQRRRAGASPGAPHP